MDAQQESAPEKTSVWVGAFLAALAETGNVTSACRAADIDRATAYRHRMGHRDFGLLWESALEEAADRLEKEALRRATEGLVRYKFDRKGEPLVHPVTKEPYYELEYSDTLLIFLLNGARPAKYRQNHRHEHAGDGGGAMKVEHLHEITLEQFRQLPTADKVKLLREMALQVTPRLKNDQ